MENLDATLTEILSEQAHTSDTPVNIVDPSPQPLQSLIQALKTHSNPPATRLLLHDDVLQIVEDEFWLASSLVELLETDRHEARLTTHRNNELLVSDTKLWNFITIDSVTGIVSSNESQTSIARPGYEYYATQWAEYKFVTLRTPPLNQVRSSLRESFGDEFESEFMQMITASASHGIGERPQCDRDLSASRGTPWGVIV